MNVPILLITFNRPEQTKAVLVALKAVRPTRLFVANDGPRASREADASKCESVRALISSEVDWPCDVQTLYRTDNLGCRRGVQAAISWFFRLVPEGIILEDDIVPDPSFFAYQAALLERYRDDPRVMVVAGHRSQNDAAWPESYRFSRFAAIWGWGSWRRVWERYEPLAESYFHEAGRERLCAELRHPELVDWWNGSLQAVAEGRLDTWDVQLCYLLLRQRGLCVVPRVRLVQNIGFGKDATHTTGEGGSEAPPTALDFPLVHPTTVRPDFFYDRVHARRNFWNRHVRLSWRLFQRLKSITKSVLRRKAQ